ncbi:MAG: hypothetical protein JWP31_2281 [Aeromicrobium sp.]|nr:hypothetical protein [Aeromicrobium sp.]
MSAVIRSEVRKLLTTRLWWVLLISMAVYMTFLGAILAFSLAEATKPDVSDPLDPAEVVRGVYSLGTSLGYAFPLIVGALLVTAEFRHRTITPTFLFQPRRHVVLLAKLAVAGGVGVMFGLAGTIGAVAGGAPVLALQDVPLLLGDAEIWVLMLLSVVALALWCLVGVGLGTVLPDQVAAIVTVLAFTQFVEPLLRLGLSAVDALEGVARFLPGAAAEAVVGSSLYTTGSSVELLTRWQGALVMITYVVVLAAIGWRTTLHRDIT